MSDPSISRRRWRYRLAIATAALVPLAFAGLFAASLGEADESLDRIPAAIVNLDETVTQTAPDGTETPVYAGRLLVTELTGAGSDGLDWEITNEDAADAALADGDVYAVLRIPAGFSASIVSLQSEEPVQAQLTIRTDDAHSYVAGLAAETVGQGMVQAFGQQVTTRYLSGLFTGLAELGASLGAAATGAADLSSGATELQGALGELATGTSSAQTGAASLAEGLSGYTAGVDALSTSLSTLETGAAGLTSAGEGVATYTSGVAQLSAGISGASAQLTDGDPSNDAAAVATIDALSARLASAAAGGATLAQQTATAVSGVQSGIAQSASAAASLAAGSSGLVSGATSLDSSLGSIASGITASQTGVGEVATGASSLGTSLQEGADQVPATDPEVASEVVAAPVGLTVERDNEVPAIGQAIASLFLPIGLWVGAIAIFLVLRPVSRPALASTAGTGRIALSTMARAGGVAAGQAVLLVALLHLGVGVDWALLPATGAFALLTAVSFTAVHYLLTCAFGRAGLVVSLLLLALQLTSAGGLFPVEVLAEPFAVVSPLLPLTYAVSGIQTIITGGSAYAAVVAALVLLGMGIVSLLLALALVRRTRRSRTLAAMAIPV